MKPQNNQFDRKQEAKRRMQYWKRRNFSPLDKVSAFIGGVWLVLNALELFFLPALIGTVLANVIEILTLLIFIFIFFNYGYRQHEQQ